MLCANFQKDLSIEAAIADGRDFEGLEFKTGFGGISFIVISLFLDPVSIMLY